MFLNIISGNKNVCCQDIQQDMVEVEKKIECLYKRMANTLIKISWNILNNLNRLVNTHLYIVTCDLKMCSDLVTFIECL